MWERHYAATLDLRESKEPGPKAPPTFEPSTVCSITP